LIIHFGLGIVILPSIVLNLNGKCGARFLESNDKKDEIIKFRISFIVPLEAIFQEEEEKSLV